MKKKIKVVIILIVISFIGYLGFSITKKIKYKSEVTERIKNIPDFSFYTLNDIPFTEKELTKNTYKLFVYFNTECDFCQHEVQQISEHLLEFENTQIIFVSFEEIEIIREFASKQKLLNKKKCTISTR
ncbi:MAG: redoxin domain-containing protein [Urechidicola sp.]|nr:redoxin domain-containing protein [Urechidicola sp.]